MVASICMICNNYVQSPINTHILITAWAPVLPLSKMRACALSPFSLLVKTFAFYCVWFKCKVLFQICLIRYKGFSEASVYNHRMWLKNSNINQPLIPNCISTSQGIFRRGNTYPYTVHTYIHVCIPEYSCFISNTKQYRVQMRHFQY